MEGSLNSLALLANYILVPGLAYGSQLALGALGVTVIYAVLNFSKQKTHIDFPLKIPVGLTSNTITRITKETANL